MAQRFIKAIGVVSTINILLVAFSLISRQDESSLIAENDSEQAQFDELKTEQVERIPTIVYQVASPDGSQATQSDPPALAVDETLATQAPLVFSLEAQPPAKDDLLMAELKRQAAEAMPATFSAEPLPLTSKHSSDSLATASINEAAKPKSALKAKSQALRQLSAAADDLAELLEQYKDQGNDKEAQAVAIQIESLKKLMREML